VENGKKEVLVHELVVFLHDGVPKEDAAQREEEWKD